MRSLVVVALFSILIGFFLGGLIRVSPHKSPLNPGGDPRDLLESDSPELTVASDPPVVKVPARQVETRDAPPRNPDEPLERSVLVAFLVSMESNAGKLSGAAKTHYEEMVAAFREWGYLAKPDKVRNLDGRFFDNLFFGHSPTLAPDFAVAWTEIIEIASGENLTSDQVTCVREVLEEFFRISAEEWERLETAYRTQGASLETRLEAERERWEIYQVYWLDFVFELSACLTPTQTEGVRRLFSSANLAAE